MDVTAVASLPTDAAIGVLVTAELDTTSNLAPDALSTVGLAGRRGEVRAIPFAGRPAIALGVGPRLELSTQNLRSVAGTLARAAGHYPTVALELPAWLYEALDARAVVSAITEGLLLGSYEYTALKSNPSRRRLAHAFLVSEDQARVAESIGRGTVRASATALARDQVNEPGGSLTPARLAEMAEALGREHGFEVEVWTEETIRAERLGGLLGVNRGSAQPARFLQLSYQAAEDAPLVALCGKGVTFDSGGLSLKNTEGMVAMKGDMGGAAAVLAAFTALPVLRPQVNVIGLLPLTDNMPGPDATRVGDVLTIRDGTTVEVLNTDAEGRLILADALALASERNPAAIVDIATLTGACMVALSDRIAGLMGNDPPLIARVQAAAEASGEPVWQLPLPPVLRKRIDSDVADLRNVADSRYGGALIAALFLQEFVGAGIPWVHLDIAGPSKSGDNDGEVVKGGTGFGTRLLLHLLESWG